MFEWEARFDGNSELVAELVSLNGFKSAYAVKDGAEGPRGWLVCASLLLILQCLLSPSLFMLKLFRIVMFFWI